MIFLTLSKLAAGAVSVASEDAYGIIFGGSGQGEAMLANRFPNVRATVFYGGELEIIRLSRAHNDANVLSIGARFVSVEEVKIAILTWLSTPVLVDEKYRRRNQKIEKITRGGSYHMIPIVPALIPTSAEQIRECFSQLKFFTRNTY